MTTNSRTRTRDLTDWSNQHGNWRLQVWGDFVTNNGANPTLQSDVTALYPQWDSAHLLFKGRETTTDENHRLRSRQDLYGHGPEDVGGPFFNQKKRCFVKPPPGGLESDAMASYRLDSSGLNQGGNWKRVKYSGPILARVPSDSLFPTYSQTNLIAKGTTAIARCKPTNNVADLATTISETIREGLPHLLGADLWESKTKNAKKAAGSEYLNYEFGWVPLVADIRNASYALANARKLIDAYERNSGRAVRRRYEFPIEKTEQTVEIGAGPGQWYSNSDHGGANQDLSKPTPRLFKTSTFYRRTWFSGSFTYHLPTGYNSRNWLERASKQAGPLLGLDLTPELLWNIGPWSWAVDWFSNAGDLISNLSDWATDGLVMRYGYIMEHTLQEDTYHLNGPTRYKPYGSVFASPITFSLETKRRVKASPFGFDVDFTGFTSRQKAIVVALGLSR